MSKIIRSTLLASAVLPLAFASSTKTAEKPVDPNTPPAPAGSLAVNPVDPNAAPQTPATSDTAAKKKQDRVSPVITASAKVAMPEAIKVKRGGKSPYDFDGLEVGTAFGIKNKTAKQISSIVSNKNRHESNYRDKMNADGTPVFKMQEMKDANGNVMKVPTSEKEREQIKEWRSYDVTAEYAKQLVGTPLEGSKVVVFRVK